MEKAIDRGTTADQSGIPVTPLLIGMGTRVVWAGESSQPPNLCRDARTLVNSPNRDGSFRESTMACLDDGDRGRGDQTQTERELEFNLTN